MKYTKQRMLTLLKFKSYMRNYLRMLIEKDNDTYVDIIILKSAKPLPLVTSLIFTAYLSSI